MCIRRENTARVLHDDDVAEALGPCPLDDNAVGDGWDGRPARLRKIDAAVASAIRARRAPAIFEVRVRERQREALDGRVNGDRENQQNAQHESSSRATY